MSSLTVIAWVDIHASLVAAAVLLIAGTPVVLLVSRHRKTSGGRSRLWIPLVSLVAGPIIGFSLWAADVFVLNLDMYPTPFQGDALATLTATIVLGMSVGVVAAIVFALSLNARRGKPE